MINNSNIAGKSWPAKYNVITSRSSRYCSSRYLSISKNCMCPFSDISCIFLSLIAQKASGKHDNVGKKELKENKIILQIWWWPSSCTIKVILSCFLSIFDLVKFRSRAVLYHTLKYGPGDTNREAPERNYLILVPWQYIKLLLRTAVDHVVHNDLNDEKAIPCGILSKEKTCYFITVAISNAIISVRQMIQSPEELIISSLENIGTGTFHRSMKSSKSNFSHKGLLSLFYDIDSTNNQTITKDVRNIISLIMLVAILKFRH